MSSMKDNNNDSYIADLLSNPARRIVLVLPVISLNTDPWRRW
jgi:hypothetical protein